MRVLISADMEGATGVTHVVDTEQGKAPYERFRRLLTQDVNAAIAGAFDGGATEVVVNEAHWTMRNILLEELDPPAHDDDVRTLAGVAPSRGGADPRPPAGDECDLSLELHALPLFSSQARSRRARSHRPPRGLTAREARLRYRVGRGDGLPDGTGCGGPPPAP